MITPTTIVPENSENNYKDYYFVWHPPTPGKTTTESRWDFKESRWVVRQVPNETLARGTGNPEPAAKLGAYARRNSEGENWVWFPMSEFAALMTAVLSGQLQPSLPPAAPIEVKLSPPHREILVSLMELVRRSYRTAQDLDELYTRDGKL